MNEMRFLIILGLAAVMLFSSCGDDVNEPDNNETPPANQVWMRNNTFIPAVLTVAPGTEVTWVNKDGVLHTTTSSSSPSLFDSGNLNRDQTFSYTFDSTGSYAYLCRLHAGMVGTVIVQ
jgi:plastocyanin